MSEQRLLIPDVRFTPTFVDSLISSDQLWETSRIKMLLHDEKVLVVPGGKPARSHRSVHSVPTRLPVHRIQCLHGLTAQCIAADLRANDSGAAPYLRPPRRGMGSARSASRCPPDAVRRPHTSSHIAALPADDAALALHRRLHLGLDIIKRLPKLTRDAPAILANATSVPCAHCCETGCF